MTTAFRFVVLVVTVLVVGCGGGEAPAAGEAAPEAAPAAAPKAAAPKGGGDAAKKPTPESRADEIIADLARRQAEQERALKEAAEKVQVVTEVSPKSAPPSRRFGSPVPGSPSYGSAASAPPPGSSNDADYWRQEFGIASARLQQAQSQLQQAQQKLRDAESQMNNSNKEVARMGREAYSRAQQEMSSAQNAVYSGQSAVDTARNNALRAGVPASYLR